MKIRNLCFLLIFVVVLSQVGFGATGIRKGALLFTGQVGIFDEGHGIFAIGGNVEYGISRNFTLGGDVSLVTGDEHIDHSSGGMLVSPSVAYHFDIKNRDLDVFVGGGFFMYLPHLFFIS